MTRTTTETRSVPSIWFSQGEMEELGGRSPFEPFVDEHVVARFLQLTPRRVLEMARRAEIPAHPFGYLRKTWRFRMSEIDAHFSVPTAKQSGASIATAVPGTQERKSTWVKGQ